MFLYRSFADNLWSNVHIFICVCILILSLTIFLKEEKQVNLKNSFYFILLCLLNLPLPIFGLATQSRVLFIKEVKLWTLFVMMGLATLIEFSTLRKAKKSRNKCIDFEVEWILSIKQYILFCQSSESLVWTKKAKSY